MFSAKMRFDKLVGVGTAELNLREGSQVYTLIGANGIGKTKTLESIFQTFFFTNKKVADKLFGYRIVADNYQNYFSFGQASFLSYEYGTPKNNVINPINLRPHQQFEHDYPILFIASQNRGFIKHSTTPSSGLGAFSKRKDVYFSEIINKMDGSFSSLNMDTDIEGWFVTLAQSANPYQKQEDNREVEIKTVLKLLHEIDGKIDPQFLEIAGDGRVSLKIDGQKRELSHLSTGFASILKMLQAIVSGYGYFTNEVQLQNVRGIVLIDEIESHLHLSWQSHIIPLFKRLFPNTTFYITTHSPIVLTQLNEGEAYRLERDADGVVRTHLIHAPNRAAMVDVLQEAFDVDLNRIKQDSSSPESQKAAKQQLLNLLKAQWGDA